MPSRVRNRARGCFSERPHCLHLINEKRPAARRRRLYAEHTRQSSLGGSDSASANNCARTNGISVMLSVRY